MQEHVVSAASSSLPLAKELIELSIFGPMLEKLPEALLTPSSILVIIGTKIGGSLKYSLTELLDDDVFCEFSVS